MARTNGGITGKKNTASFGKCTVTTKTSSGNVTAQSGTTLVNAFVVGGGGAGASDRGGGGGSGYTGGLESGSSMSSGGGSSGNGVNGEIIITY